MPEERHITGRECRAVVRSAMAKVPPRRVPAFTYQALQKNTVVIPPPKVNIYKKRPVKQTLFEIYFKRGDIPVVKFGRASKAKQDGTMQYPLKWACDPANLDYCYYLPIVIDGLADRDEDLRQLAEFAAMDMIIKCPQKLLPVLPKVIMPMKRALNTRDKRIIVSCLKVLQLMVSVGPCVGQALVPYYRQLLAICNLFKNLNVNLGAGVDNERSNRAADVIEDTLKLLETCGGPNAYINIKYMVPTYESNVFPRCDEGGQNSSK